MIVADVHLIAYLLLGGPGRVLAQRVLERDPVWAAPRLWRSEFRSVLAAYMRQRDLRVSDAWRAHELAERLLEGHEFDVPGQRVLTLVASSSCSSDGLNATNGPAGTAPMRCLNGYVPTHHSPRWS